ncbi:MAG: hypothetical protein U5L00_07385 [Desulfovermiculus sp.]|nr:hypothetical protein [Desulfovermiculus sp.]
METAIGPRYQAKVEEQVCEHDGLLELEGMVQLTEAVAVIYRCLGCGQEVAEFEEVEDSISPGD